MADKAPVTITRRAKWISTEGQVYKVGEEFLEPNPRGYAKRNPPTIVSISVAVNTGVTPVVVVGILMSDHSEHYLSTNNYLYELAESELL